jgi:hypothetical protein
MGKNILLVADTITIVSTVVAPWEALSEDPGAPTI